MKTMFLFSSLRDPLVRADSFDLDGPLQDETFVNAHYAKQCCIMNKIKSRGRRVGQKTIVMQSNSNTHRINVENGNGRARWNFEKRTTTSAVKSSKRTSDEERNRWPAFGVEQIRSVSAATRNAVRQESVGFEVRFVRIAANFWFRRSAINPATGVTSFSLTNPFLGSPYRPWIVAPGRARCGPLPLPGENLRFFLFFCSLQAANGKMVNKKQRWCWLTLQPSQEWTP